MGLKGTKIYSISTGTCPRCMEESMYETSNPYNLSKTIKLNEKCSHCGLVYTIEPSFFYGSMYVSYAISTFFAILAFIISFLALELTLVTTFVVIVATLVILYPPILRWSRNVWINMFVKFDKNWKSHN